MFSLSTSRIRGAAGEALARKASKLGATGAASVSEILQSPLASHPQRPLEEGILGTRWNPVGFWRLAEAKQRFYALDRLRNPPEPGQNPVSFQRLAETKRSF